MDRKAQAFAIPCHNFSDIRRRPLVIGKLDQVRLPFVVTMPQLAVGVIVFALLFLTRPAWGSIMSDRLHIVVFVVVPVVVAQQISRTSIEGRSLSKAAIGLFRLWTSPRYGTINGRRQRQADTTTLRLQPLIDDRDRRPRVRRTGGPNAPSPGDRGQRRSASRRFAPRRNSVSDEPQRGTASRRFASRRNSVSDEPQRGTA